MVRAGFIKFRSRDDSDMGDVVGIATFKDGQCVFFLYNEPLLRKYMNDAFGDLYQVPEYLNHVIAGMAETFWNSFLARTSTFLQFTTTRDYQVDEIEEEGKHFLEYMKLLNE